LAITHHLQGLVTFYKIFDFIGWFPSQHKECSDQVTKLLTPEKLFSDANKLVRIGRRRRIRRRRRRRRRRKEDFP
jgi:hypothetical protein